MLLFVFHKNLHIFVRCRAHCDKIVYTHWAVFWEAQTLDMQPKDKRNMKQKAELRHTKLKKFAHGPTGHL